LHLVAPSLRFMVTDSVVAVLRAQKTEPAGLRLFSTGHPRAFSC
jgi:hypothetical protein